MDITINPTDPNALTVEQRTVLHALLTTALVQKKVKLCWGWRNNEKRQKDRAPRRVIEHPVVVDGTSYDVLLTHSILRQCERDSDNGKAFIITTNVVRGKGGMARVRELSNQIIWVTANALFFGIADKRVIKVAKQSFRFDKAPRRIPTQASGLDEQQAEPEAKQREEERLREWSFLSRETNEDNFTDLMYPNLAVPHFLRNEQPKLDSVITGHLVTRVVKSYRELPDLGTSLSDLIDQKQWKPTLDEGMWFCEQLAHGVLMMKEKGFIHRDLTCGNVLIDGRKLHIIDFNLAIRIGEPAGYQAGTYTTMAPEVVKKKQVITSAVDVYALASLFALLLGGSKHEIYRARSRDEQTCGYDFSKVLLMDPHQELVRAFLNRLSQEIPEHRPSIDECILFTQQMQSGSVFRSLRRLYDNQQKFNDLTVTAQEKLAQFVHRQLFAPKAHRVLLGVLDTLLRGIHSRCRLLVMVEPTTLRIGIDSVVHRQLVECTPAEGRSAESQELLAINENRHVNFGRYPSSRDLSHFIIQVSIGIARYQSREASHVSCWSTLVGSDMTGWWRAQCYAAVIGNNAFDASVQWLFLHALLQHQSAKQLQRDIQSVIPNSRDDGSLKTVVALQVCGLFGGHHRVTQKYLRQRQLDVQTICNDGDPNQALLLATQIEHDTGIDATVRLQK